MTEYQNNKSFTKKCRVCKKPFKVFPYQEKIGRGFYCSKDCVWKSPERNKKIGKKMKIVMVGNKHPLGYKRKPYERELIRKRMYGKKLSENTKDKIRKSHKKHWDKVGRIPKRRRWSAKYQEWRMRAFQRDNFTCQFCRVRGTYLVVHHIKPWAKYKKLRYNLDNGITLCQECHKLAHKKYGK